MTTPTNANAPTTSLEVRERLVDALRLGLVGGVTHHLTNLNSYGIKIGEG